MNYSKSNAHEKAVAEGANEIYSQLVAENKFKDNPNKILDKLEKRIIKINNIASIAELTAIITGGSSFACAALTLFDIIHGRFSTADAFLSVGAVSSGFIARYAYKVNVGAQVMNSSLIRLYTSLKENIVK